MKELLPKELEVLQHLTLEIYGYLVDDKEYYDDAFKDAGFLSFAMLSEIEKFFKRYESPKSIGLFAPVSCLNASHFTALKIIKSVINSNKPENYNGEILSDKVGGVGLDEIICRALRAGLASIFSENHLRYKNDL